jgi:cytochrome c oxidase assembly protein subunit 15
MGALVAGLGITVALAGTGFLFRIPPATLPGPALLGVLAALVVVGGGFAARASGDGIRAGMAAGFSTSVWSLLLLGGVLGGASPNSMAADRILWIPGFLGTCTLLGGIGALPVRRATGTRPDWLALHARVTVAATGFLVLIGGLVTTHGAGLAVTDWPNSFGYSMFLYPFSRMVGGIFYEHSHRVFGSLVGLATLTLAIHAFRADSRRGVRIAGVAALGFVILQGILGGLRVTGHFTWSASPEETAPNLLLAVLHGVSGQVFFAFMAVFAAVTSRAWKTLPSPGESRPTAWAKTLPALAVLTLLLQIALGARVRHTGQGLIEHFAFAAVAAGFAVATGAHSLKTTRDPRSARSVWAGALVGLIGIQILLGFGILRGWGWGAAEALPFRVRALVETAHQTVGALLLGSAALLAAWGRRRPPEA